MFIEKIKLRNFRNYQASEISFSKNLNVILGDNAQGKTNIIEAIYLCATGRSHRTIHDNDLIRFGSNDYYIFLRYNKNNLDTDIEISYNEIKKKSIKINEIPLAKIGKLIGNLNIVLFSPETLSVVKQGPSERRRFLDILISQIKPSYFYDLQQLNKILSQRNSLLKSIQKRKQLEETIDVWDRSLAQISSKIFSNRNYFVEKLSRFAKKNHYKLTNNDEKLLIEYVPSVKIENFLEISDIEKSYYKLLKKNIEKDIFRGTTSIGPQKDDFNVLINDCNIKLFGSQGQQRTAVLSLKLSEMDIMVEMTGEHPILLLDDVMSELDEKRQQLLLNSLSNVQGFITCTHLEDNVSNLISDKYFVKSGEIVKI